MKRYRFGLPKKLAFGDLFRQRLKKCLRRGANSPPARQSRAIRFHFGGLWPSKPPQRGILTTCGAAMHRAFLLKKTERRNRLPMCVLRNLRHYASS